MQFSSNGEDYVFINVCLNGFSSNFRDRSDMAREIIWNSYIFVCLFACFVLFCFSGISLFYQHYKKKHMKGFSWNCQDMSDTAQGAISNIEEG